MGTPRTMPVVQGPRRAHYLHTTAHHHHAHRLLSRLHAEPHQRGHCRFDRLALSGRPRAAHRRFSGDPPDHRCAAPPWWQNVTPPCVASAALSRRASKGGGRCLGAWASQSSRWQSSRAWMRRRDRSAYGILKHSYGTVRTSSTATLATHTSLGIWYAQETRHSHPYQPLSGTVSVPAMGTVTVSSGSRVGS